MKLNNQGANFLAVGLLILMIGLAFFSMRGDSTTMDELAHIPAGYSYIVQKDMRLNPEHPPLLKDLAGFSVWLGSKITNQPINFPAEHKSWKDDINDQWDFGATLLYQNNNNPDQIVFWGRLPLLLIMLLLGIYVFKWTRQIYGNSAGLLALFFYALSPTFLAHGRLVTTDVGAAAAFFIAAYYLVKWLNRQNTKNLIVAGLILGLAFLTKFSLNLLIPYFVFLAVVWALVNQNGHWFGRLAKTFLLLLLIGLIGLALVWPVYQFHVWNYPADRQYRDADFVLKSFGTRWLADPVVWMSDKPLLRPYGQFFTGMLMVIQRAVGGNTTYFWGEVSATGWKSYFPVVFLIKEPLPFLILAFFGLIWAIASYRWRKTIPWIKNNFPQFALWSLFVFYWLVTLRSNLNIGVRHILPTLPILYVLVSGQISQIIKRGCQRESQPEPKCSLFSAVALIVLMIMLGWYAFNTIKIYPSFLAYFNELVGGPSQGYKYVTDSNLDWGQDLKRLAQFVEKNNIKTIYVDYFGGDSVEYRLGEKFQSWHSDYDPNNLLPNSWLAVSATFLQEGRGKPAPGFTSKTGRYNWLNQYQPVTVIGHSIFVYQIP